MKYPEYDSPFELVMNDITIQMAKNIDELCWQAVQRIGINVNKEKLLLALEYDSSRYREAYANGYDTGYEKREEEIIRCRDCKHYHDGQFYYCEQDIKWCEPDWFCADGEKRID